MSNLTYALGAVALLLAAAPSVPAATKSTQTKATSSAPGKDPFVGTWLLDFGKSDFKRVAAPSKKTLVFSPLADGLSLKETILNGNGGTDSLQFLAKFDGKTYDAPPESPLSQVSFRRVDPNTVEETGIERNKPVEELKFQLSNGGKTLTVITNATNNPAGDSVQVFDRQ
jgi:hypothetical protein